MRRDKTVDKKQLFGGKTLRYGGYSVVITAIVLVVSSIREKKGSGQPASLGLNYFREER